MIGRSDDARNGSEEQARSLFLDFLLRRFQGHDPDFQSLLREHPELREPLRSVRAQFEPLLHEHFRNDVPDDFAEHLESIAVTAEAAQRMTPPSKGEGAANKSSGWGRYQQIEEIARGGMGKVWRVWDQLLDRPLAMKVIAVDSKTPLERERLVRRFLREAAITAQLDHPGVVPVHEVGRDPDDRVFFTMRLVQGSDLHEILQPAGNSERWTRLDVLGVLLKVCETIEFAHSRGIIHRDLKPANIMVGSYGEAYVMDWGLARVLDDTPLAQELVGEAIADETLPPLVTGAGTLLGTPVYMAPEQARGEVDQIGPWTDVYAIGAMLYTLLAGHPPHLPPGETPTSAEVVEKIRAGTKTPIPQLDNVPRRLAQICDEAMQHDPQLRLRSVAELRHRLRSYFEAAQQSEEEAQRARDSAARDQKVAQFMIELFEVADPTEALGETLTARDLVDRGAGKIEQQLQDQPIVQARLFHAIGDIYLKMGHYEAARELLTKAIELRCQHLGASHLAVADSSITLGQVHLAEGDYDGAEAKYGRAAEILRSDAAVGGDEAARMMLRVLQQQANVDHERGHFVAAEKKFRKVLEELDALPATSGFEYRTQDRAECLGNLAWLLQTCGRYEESERLHREALKLCEEECDANSSDDTIVHDHPSIAMHKNRLASLFQNTGRYEEAETLYRDVLATRTKVLGERHPLVAVSLNNLAVLLRLRGDYDGGEALYRQALAIYETRLGEDHPKTAIALSNLALLLSRKKQLDESDALHERSLRACYKTLGKEHVAIAANLSNLGHNQLLRGNLEEASHYNEQAEQQFRSLLGDRHPFVARCLVDRAAIDLAAGDTDGAEEAANEALTIQRTTLSDDHIDLAHTETQLAHVARARGRWEDAQRHATQALRQFTRALPAGDAGLERPRALVAELADAAPNQGSGNGIDDTPDR
ncbi:MAG: serine/threonine-protein kinase [Planctomycetota bacterium]